METKCDFKFLKLIEAFIMSHLQSVLCIPEENVYSAAIQ